MAIKTIHIRNFKTFREADVSLGMLNVLIGPNASGKSNFVDALRFLRDIASDGLSNAISLQGGVDYVTNKNLGPSAGLSMRIVWEHRLGYARETVTKGLVGFRASRSAYDFELKFGKDEPRTRVVKDVLDLDGTYIELKRSKSGKLEEGAELGKGRETIRLVKDELQFKAAPPKELASEFPDIGPWPYFPDKKPPRDALLLGMPEMAYLFEALECSVYDFDPKLPKRSVGVTGKRELEEDGSNLAIVLSAIREDPEKRSKFANLVKDLLPFVEDVDTERLPDKTLLFKLRETYTPGVYLPAPLMSDGTVNVTALVVALYFEAKRLIVVEEPERNIHPSLIRNVVGMMKEASAGKQIIVTTHSPEIVKHADLQDIILISRGKDGCSKVSRPAEQDEVKTFLQTEIGIEDLYVDNLLKA